jgi:hypothetical protein
MGCSGGRGWTAGKPRFLANVVRLPFRANSQFVRGFLRFAPSSPGHPPAEAGLRLGAYGVPVRLSLTREGWWA